MELRFSEPRTNRGARAFSWTAAASAGKTQPGARSDFAVLDREQPAALSLFSRGHARSQHHGNEPPGGKPASLEIDGGRTRLLRTPIRLRQRSRTLSLLPRSTPRLALCAVKSSAARSR